MSITIKLNKTHKFRQIHVFEAAMKPKKLKYFNIENDTNIFIIYDFIIRKWHTFVQILYTFRNNTI